MNGRIQPDERIIPEEVVQGSGRHGFRVGMVGRTLSPSHILKIDDFTLGTEYRRPFPQRRSGPCEGNHGDEGRAIPV